MKKIMEALTRMQKEGNIRILYACEAGSRAWGFESQDSDFDVRFLYAWPMQDYLRLDPPLSTIEYMSDDLDLVGWDIFKALRLFRKSNPPLFEWLFSPIVYIEQSPQIDQLRDLARNAYSSRAIFHHYSKMADRNYRQYISNRLSAGETKVLLKKYLYVVRPIVALLYVEQHRQLPPTSFLETLSHINLQDNIRVAILDLVDKKKAGLELGMGASIPILNTLADEHLQRWLGQNYDEEQEKQAFQGLDRILLDTID